MNTAIIRQDTPLMCWMFSSLGHTEKLGELIRSYQFKLNVIPYLSDSLRAALVVEFDMMYMYDWAPSCTQTCSLQFKTHLTVTFLDVTKLGRALQT